jgi:predicted transcriptional regulator
MSTDDHPVREVIKEIVGDQTISAEQVRTLEKYVKEDWVIDQNEAKLLFRMNKALKSNHDDCPEWTKFFVTSISRFVVMDMNSPGEIDETEGDWLAEMLDEYSVENASEKQLILEIQKCTTSIKGKLGERIE